MKELSQFPSLSQILYPEVKTTCRLNSRDGNRDFHVWKNKLDFILFDNNVKHVLVEKIPDKKNDHFGHEKFLEDDFTARHIILSCMHDDLHLSFHHHQSAKSLLDALASFFAKPSIPKWMQMYESYKNRRMSEDTCVGEHLVRMRATVKELEFAGLKVSESEQAEVLVKSLPESWRKLTGSLSVELRALGLSLEDVEEKAREWEVKARGEQEEEEGGRKLLRLQDIRLKDVVMVVGSITIARMILRIFD